MALILFVEYHSAFRQAASYVMNQEPDLKVVAQGGSVAEGRQRMAQGGIDAAIVDIPLPDEGAPEMVRDLHGANPSIPVLVLTALGEYRGICSSYLAEQSVGGVIECFVRPPSTPFVPPEDASTPMIMVAAGTGLAPFRGFLQEREMAKQEGKRVGPSMLFFGCRNPQQDYIYEEELEEFAREGVAALECAFSRLEGQPKTYVQNRIEAQQEDIWPLVEGGAIIYVCGDAGRMAPEVERAFVDLFRNRNGVTEQEAEEWMAELKKSKRYLLDVWPRN